MLPSFKILAPTGRPYIRCWERKWACAGACADQHRVCMAAHLTQWSPPNIFSIVFTWSIACDTLKMREGQELDVFVHAPSLHQYWVSQSQLTQPISLALKSLIGLQKPIVPAIQVRGVQIRGRSKYRGTHEYCRNSERFLLPAPLQRYIAFKLVSSYAYTGNYLIPHFTYLCSYMIRIF